MGMDQDARRTVRLRSLRDQYRAARWEQWQAELRLAEAAEMAERARRRADRVRAQIATLRGGG